MVSTGFEDKVIFTRFLGDLDNLVIYGYNNWVQNNQVGTWFSGERLKAPSDQGKITRAGVHSDGSP